MGNKEQWVNRDELGILLSAGVLQRIARVEPSHDHRREPTINGGVATTSTHSPREEGMR
jgi:hypothetical protein